MRYRVIDRDPRSADDAERRQHLVEQATREYEAGEPKLPKAHPLSTRTPRSHAGRIELIQRVVHAWGRAAYTVQESSLRGSGPHVDVLVADVLTLMAWTRTLDEVCQDAWKAAHVRRREEASARTDRRLAWLDKPDARPHGDYGFVTAYGQRKLDGKPYRDWADGMIGSGVGSVREELDAFRWLAGKMLHLGPRLVVERRQYMEGAEPRWKWRDDRDVFPPGETQDRNPAHRVAYRRHLAGRDMAGVFSRFHEWEIDMGFCRLLSPRSGSGRSGAARDP